MSRDAHPNRRPLAARRGRVVRDALPRTLASLCAVAALASPLAAQEAEVRLDLRVVASHPGGLVDVDRGTRDGVRAGDEVLLTPRGGDVLTGSVTRVEEGTALVELRVRGALPDPGTKGAVFVPASRFDVPADQPAVPPPPEHPPWSNDDAAFAKGDALLAKVSVLHPEQRPLRVDGRASFDVASTDTSEGGRSDSLLRTGLDLSVENPLGRGGVFTFAADLSRRATHEPGVGDEHRTVFRTERASYAWGGTRWEPDRQEVGRFLQPVAPELGLLDGWAWTRRREGGDLFGVSVGFVPEDDRNLSTGADVQLAGSYRANLDDADRTAVTGAYQKTWHHGTPDRDLFVASVQHLPSDGWTLRGSAWVDAYTASDDAKGAGLGLTRAYASARRKLSEGDETGFTWTHQEFPELRADGLVPLTSAALADAHSDRLAWFGTQRASDVARVRAEVGGWTDQDDSGGDVEVGLDLRHLFVRDARASCSLFATSGAFSDGVGARVGYGWPSGEGSWDLAYEVVRYENKGFVDGFGETIQHWLRVGRDVRLTPQWDLLMSADARVWDRERSLTLTVHLGRRF
ncbi:MAG: hypothetical protein H6825_08210 [Planctomycetes bacterium]|nr:hypothetical protein [Planctomycetota bacterium]